MIARRGVHYCERLYLEDVNLPESRLRAPSGAPDQK